VLSGMTSRQLANGPARGRERCSERERHHEVERRYLWVRTPCGTCHGDPDEAPQGRLPPTCLIGPRAPLRRGVRRPADTPFEDGTFKLTLQFQEDYPNKPPTVRFVSAMFHPNGTALAPPPRPPGEWRLTTCVPSSAFPPSPLHTRSVRGRPAVSRHSAESLEPDIRRGRHPDLDSGTRPRSRYVAAGQRTHRLSLSVRPSTFYPTVVALARPEPQ